MAVILCRPFLPFLYPYPGFILEGACSSFEIYNRFRHLLEELNQNWIDPQLFSDAIHTTGAPLQNCWGFIDGTLRPFCRPVRNQRILFSGHKRIHGQKCQVCAKL